MRHTILSLAALLCLGACVPPPESADTATPRRGALACLSHADLVSVTEHPKRTRRFKTQGRCTTLRMGEQYHIHDAGPGVVQVRLAGGSKELYTYAGNMQ